MKNLLLIAIAILGFSAVSFGQTGQTATATASATIVTPISITKNLDLSFGNIAVNGNLGTVTVPAADAATRTFDGGVTLPAITGTVTAAKFTIKGTDGYAYKFTVPQTEVKVIKGSDEMLVDTWTTSTIGTTSSTGDVVYLGATIHVGATQPAGLYTSTGFSVKVDYE